MVQVTRAVVRHASPTAAVGPTSLSLSELCPSPRDACLSQLQLPPDRSADCLSPTPLLYIPARRPAEPLKLLTRGLLLLLQPPSFPLPTPSSPTGHSSATSRYLHHGGKGGRSVPRGDDAADRSVQYALDQVSGKSSQSPNSVLSN